MRTRVAIGTCLVMVVLAMASLLPSGAQRTAVEPQVNAPPPLSNPLKIALLHWYRANETARFPVGNEPYGVCFDGANIWTANFGDGTVMKLTPK